MTGKFSGHLVEAYEKNRTFFKENVFNYKDIITVELAGYCVMGNLLKLFSELIWIAKPKDLPAPTKGTSTPMQKEKDHEKAVRDVLSVKQQLLLDKLPKRWRKQLVQSAFEDQCNGPYLRAVIITDFFTCMTEHTLSIMHSQLNGVF
eukprot:TRINITY_DN368_c0_g1_i1.p3 TRINITY_DN368_c0_g1~~TRINITY_DN368_c0_g1_i1.p3  ORF type:complete len:147 (-),score=47.72 TRINITY_DN368_c0_g1_i1:1073-1513(-)